MAEPHVQPASFIPGQVCHLFVFRYDEPAEMYVGFAEEKGPGNDNNTGPAPDTRDASAG